MRVWTIIMLGVALAAALTAVPAQTHAQRGSGPCRDDVQKFCSGVHPGAGRYRDCLEQHAAELSPPCQAHMAAARARMAAWRQACQEDAQKFCSGVTPGGGNLAKCLHAHHADLSQACRDQLAQQRPRRQKPPPAGAAQ